MIFLEKFIYAMGILLLFITSAICVRTILEILSFRKRIRVEKVTQALKNSKNYENSYQVPSGKTMHL